MNQSSNQQSLLLAAAAATGFAAGYAAVKLSTKSESTKSEAEYVPPKVWENKVVANKFAAINAPTAGAREQITLPVGRHSLQLYSLGTPNGVKCTIMLEELCEKFKDFEYDAHIINIMEGKQFGSDFVDLNPNSKIPCMADHGAKDAEGKPLRIFESASILLYLAEKYDYLLPKDPAARTECLNWVFWQMGSAPYLGGGFGHFYAYAPVKMEYPINRFAMEAKRQLDVLDKNLEGKTYMCGEEYTIADIAIWPWYGILCQGNIYGDSAEFLQVKEYKNLQRWTAKIAERTAVRRGKTVNKSWGGENENLKERHSRDDFKTIGLHDTYPQY